MNRVVNRALVFFFLLTFSCTQEQQKIVKSAHDYQVSTLIFGVGYDQSKAESDLNSVFYAYKQGVLFQYSKIDLKLKLDYSNKPQLLTIEDLTKANMKKIMDHFYVDELPYSSVIKIQGSSEKEISTSLNISKPFSYLSRLLAKGIDEANGNSVKKIKRGYVYILSLNYEKNADQSLTINADLLLTEEVE